MDENENNEIQIAEQNPITTPTLPNIPMAQAPKVKEYSDYTELAKDYVGALATKKAVEDAELVTNLTERKKEELVERAEATLKDERAKNAESDKNLQISQFGVYEGVAILAGVKRNLPKGMQTVLFGILSFFQTIILIIAGVPVSVINILCDCIDAVCKKLASIVKSARLIFIGLILAGIAVLATALILHFLRKYGIIN